MTERHDRRRKAIVESTVASDGLSGSVAERIPVVVGPKRRVVAASFKNPKVGVAVRAVGLWSEGQ